MRGVFDTNEETQRLLSPTLLVYDSQISRLVSLLGTAAGDAEPAWKASRPLIAGLLCRARCATGPAADFRRGRCAGASFGERQQAAAADPCVSTAPQGCRSREGGGRASIQSCARCFLPRSTSSRPWSDGPSSIPLLRQQELDLIADAGRVLDENSALSDRLTEAAEQLVDATKQEVRRCNGLGLARSAAQHAGDYRASRAQSAHLDRDRLALCRPQHCRAPQSPERDDAGDRRRRPQQRGCRDRQRRGRGDGPRGRGFPTERDRARRALGRARRGGRAAGASGRGTHRGSSRSCSNTRPRPAMS